MQGFAIVAKRFVCGIVSPAGHAIGEAMQSVDDRRTRFGGPRPNIDCHVGDDPQHLFQQELDNLPKQCWTASLTQ